MLAKNAATLAMRPALEERYKDALATLDADRDFGRLDTVTRGDTISGLSRMFERVGIGAVQWYGVQVFTAHLGDRRPDTTLPDIV